MGGYVLAKAYFECRVQSSSRNAQRVALRAAGSRNASTSESGAP
jgi:hypothetical protein